jgi:phosphatidylserine/phosphatidylglycerophosphate/cardiolipin synthase-like enzyme
MGKREGAAMARASRDEAEAAAGGRIARPETNCWRIEHADRAAFLVDGAGYFGMLARTLERAERAVYILGWDVNSRVFLLPEDCPTSLPRELLPLLKALVERNDELQVYVLNWDFSLLYVLEREMLPMVRRLWDVHERIHFRFDAAHPIGGSQHQKIIVVDDEVAFVGGMDLASSRWDTREHAPGDKRRLNPWGRYYPPHHDVQMAVDGEAARALGELARDRWLRATGDHLEPARGSGDAWPPDHEPDVRDVEVAIALTDPPSESRRERREVERLYADMIKAARKTIYIENQYVTSAKVRDAIVERLSADDCPEIVMVVPVACSGWLEEQTMGLLRARLLARLREADRCGRLCVYAPHSADGVPINVHAKVMIVDDEMVRIGSSNLANRSMGLDTECDLMIEAAGREDVQRAIEQVRNGLVAEHLGVSVEDLAASLDETGSLSKTIERLRHDGRSLRPLEAPVETWLDGVMPETVPLDPDEPIATLERLEQLLTEPSAHPGRLPTMGGLALLGLAVAAPLARSFRTGGQAARSGSAFARAARYAAAGVGASLLALGLRSRMRACPHRGEGEETKG